jgi:CDP-paratose 2-epimerase
MRTLITGDAGFVGSSLAIALSRSLTDSQVCAFDNLRRRGSELALGRLAAAGVEFVHGDVRAPEDLAAAGRFDLLIDCSAEPSVHAGYGNDPSYVVHTNLTGTVHCLEAARRSGAGVIFLSSSRVYPIPGLRALPLERRAQRLDIPRDASGTGWSACGLTAEFPLTGFRSLYGATKLASELLIEEYRAMYGVRAVINRCGVIAGPWQMGKVDQGFIALWAARHEYGGSLTYTGFGGEGHQVRDVLHVDDLSDLIRIEISNLDRLSGAVFNAGGGVDGSLSLAELTTMCQVRSGTTLAIACDPQTRDADVPYYCSDNGAVTAATGWRPRRTLDMLLDDVFSWLRAERRLLEPILAAPAHQPPPPVPVEAA